MSPRKNRFGQAVGDAVPDWTAAKKPPRTAIAGRFCRIEPLDIKRHLEDLYESFCEDTDGTLWTYMADGPFESVEQFRHWMERASMSDDPFFHALIDSSTGCTVGVAAYMRIKPDIGVIEVGNITYSPRLQKTPAATEAMYLMMKRVFSELGYRRYEWKCDALNEASKRAAERLGFTFDGVFEQAIIYKGRNRDTAWYSVLDRDWPTLEKAYRKWLDPENFDENGNQVLRLEELIRQER